ncbi:snRNA-activating protein complex subunit 4-like [Anabrus simplex]|uniref:snRNA-activating protein complex subunit 4-like n=1 Tax=Anabrus simplex TaxID=316456 RepID=UPI0035A323E4
MTDSLELNVCFNSVSELEKLETCLKWNQACDKELQYIEDTLIELRAEDEQQLHDIQAYIKDINKNTTTSLSKNKEYGFDPSGQFFSSPPPNKDAVDRVKKGFLSYVDLPSTRLWKADEIIKLESSIRSSEIEAHVKECHKVEKAITEQLVQCNDSTMRDNLQKKLDKCRHFCDIISRLELKELLAFSKVDQYDWLKIAVVDLGGMRSDSECRLMWENYLHPDINKSEWTREEDIKLQTLAENYKFQDWDTIAKELEMQRTAFQCASRYHRFLNKNMRNSKWTKEDDKALQHCIQKFQIGNYIPWQKVAYYMENRTKLQLYNRWCYSLNPTIHKGRFTKEEDILILAGIKKYGKDFSQISQYLHGRTSVQVRDRYNTIVQYMKPSGSWTEEEDALLLELVKKYGEGKWSKISQFFSNRNRTQIRHHYATMQKWIKNNPGRSLLTIKKTISNNFGQKKILVIHKKKIEFKETHNELEVDMNLLELKQKLGLGGKRRGRKVGQKKVQGVLDKKFVHYFRCAYMQRGGRKKVRYDEVQVENRVQEMNIMLDSLAASLRIPCDALLQRDDSLSQMDRYILQSLRSRKEEPHCETSTILCYPPNHTTILGFRTLLLNHCNLRADSERVSQPQVTYNEHRSLALWKRRFTSLFRWASRTVMTTPTVLGELFPASDEPLATGCDLEDISIPQKRSQAVDTQVQETQDQDQEPQLDTGVQDLACPATSIEKGSVLRRTPRNLKRVSYKC